MPLSAAFSRASAASIGSRSTAMIVSPGTRAARHRNAAPLPQPSSSTVSPARAGTAAASSTASCPARRPAFGCRSLTRPPSNSSSVSSPVPDAGRKLAPILAGSYVAATRTEVK